MTAEVQRIPKGNVSWEYALKLERVLGELIGNRARDAGEALADAETRLAARIAAIEERLAAIEERLAAIEARIVETDQ
jgi:uncharacterized protein YceH (UPF0502 family)